jgi:hypothetical protein
MHIRFYDNLSEARVDRWALYGVLGLSAIMLGAILCWIVLYGHNVPYSEDWSLVAPLVGRNHTFLNGRGLKITNIVCLSRS